MGTQCPARGAGLGHAKSTECGKHAGHPAHSPNQCCECGGVFTLVTKSTNTTNPHETVISEDRRAQMELTDREVAHLEFTSWRVNQLEDGGS